jgi:hypothetical protein
VDGGSRYDPAVIIGSFSSKDREIQRSDQAFIIIVKEIDNLMDKVTKAERSLKAGEAGTS